MQMPWEISERATDAPVLVGIKDRSLLARGLGRGRLRRYIGRPCPYCQQIMVWSNGGMNGRRNPSRDHRVPICRGGLNVAFNITVCCRECNERKGPLDEEEFMAWKEGRASRLDLDGPKDRRRQQHRWRMMNLTPYIHHTRLRLQYCAVTRRCGGAGGENRTRDFRVET